MKRTVGAVANVVGIRRGAISGNMNVRHGVWPRCRNDGAIEIKLLDHWADYSKNSAYFLMGPG